MGKLLFEDQLDELLDRDVNSIINQHHSVFDRLVATDGESYVLFGAGRLGRIALAGLRKAEVQPLAFADNNPTLWNTTVDGLQVLSPQDATRQYAQTAFFVVTVYTSAPVLLQLLNLGLKVIPFASLAWKYSRYLLPHGDLDLPYVIFNQADYVRKALSIWSDDASRQEYMGQLKWRTSLDQRILPPHLAQRDIYFPDDLLIPSSGEVFVDCGAFDGDTVKEFIKRRKSIFGHIIAIEPDPANCKALQTYLSTLSRDIGSKITTMQRAVGSNREMVRFNATGSAASSIGNGTFQVECVPLDDLMQGYKPTYVKMDIEGAEPEALSGARKVIEKDTPILAICLYHKQEHLWQIPLLIRSYSDQYKLFLRRYADECWELVCYAVPASRFRS